MARDLHGSAECGLDYGFVTVFFHKFWMGFAHISWAVFSWGMLGSTVVFYNPFPPRPLPATFLDRCNGNAMFQSYLSKLRSTRSIQKRNQLKIRSYRRYGEHEKKMFVFPGLFVHATVRGGTCSFTLKNVNTLIKNSSRDDRPSIST